MAPLLLAAPLVLGACSRPPAGAGEGDAATPPSSAALAPVEPADASARPTPATPVTPREARRARVARFAEEPALAGAVDLLDRHFAGAAKGGFDLQSADLPFGGRRAYVVTASGLPLGDARPIVLVTDERGSVAWTKERPVAGILPPVSALAIAAGPRGRVAMAVCDPPTKTVALRLWDDDGSPFADFQVLELEGCEDVSLLHWPGHGWIVVAIAVGATKARLITENGSLKWSGGLDLGVRSRPGLLAPASLAPDTDDTFVLVQAAPPDASPDAKRHALAFRYDSSGGPIWPQATDLGALTAPPAPGERIEVTPTRPAGVHVTTRTLDVDLKPSGAFTHRPPAKR